MRAPLVDCSLSFLVVLIVTVVFVVSGTIVLGPNHKIPNEGNLLGLQSAFVTGIHPWLLPLYVTGAFLAMLGTLYGTLEVGCSIAAEMAYCVSRQFALRYARRIRRGTMLWCALGALSILSWLVIYHATGEAGKPRLLLAILTPANLFTGVLGCGLFCLLNWWTDRRFLPKALRMPLWLTLLNLLAAIIFIGLGIKGYWDDRSRWFALGTICGILALGWLAASLVRSRARRN